MRDSKITTKENTISVNNTTEKKSQSNEPKVKFEKPRVVRIRRIVAAGGHKG
jgi:hypothetical protein